MSLAARCLSVALVLAASPAAAQWTPILDVPVTDIFTVSATGDTIAAGADTAVYVSVDAGATWTQSAKVAAGVTSIRDAMSKYGVTAPTSRHSRRCCATEPAAR